MSLIRQKKKRCPEFRRHIVPLSMWGVAPQEDAKQAFSPENREPHEYGGRSGRCPCFTNNALQDCAKSQPGLDLSYGGGKALFSRPMHRRRRDGRFFSVDWRMGVLDSNTPK